jgi:hypothetical protein
VELLKLDKRADFLIKIKSRLRNLKDHFLNTLKKAYLLFDAVTTNILLIYTLIIKRQVDLKLINFKTALSLNKALLKL